MAKSTKSKKEGPDLRAFFDYIQDISTEKGLGRDEVLEVVKSSLMTSYHKKYGMEAEVEIILDRETPEVAGIVRYRVVENVENEDQELTLDGAKEIDPEAQIGGTVEIRDNPFDFSRIGATNVRQILLQRLKELEREIIYNEFKAREDDLVNGSFLRWRDRDLMYVDLGKAEGILPRREQIPNEKFRPGDRIKAVIKSVELRRERSREPGPFITLSRASGNFVKKLFEMEIPEIYDGVVEILAISRNAGYRTKLLVRSNRNDVDPVGACVGIKGVRIQSIVRELGNERIDIVNFSDDAGELIANALSPAKVTEVRVKNDLKEALVVVPDDSYSLAIGNNGQNVKLASQLTGYRLIVKSQTQFNDEISTPEARERLEAIFSSEPVVVEVEQEPSYSTVASGMEELFAPAAPVSEAVDDDFTGLSELPGLSPRVIELLEATGINSVEALVEMDAEDLENIPGIGKTTSKQIMKILSESVEFEEI